MPALPCTAECNGETITCTSLGQTSEQEERKHRTLEHLELISRHLQDLTSKLSTALILPISNVFSPHHNPGMHQISHRSHLTSLLLTASKPAQRYDWRSAQSLANRQDSLGQQDAISLEMPAVCRHELHRSTVLRLCMALVSAITHAAL